MEYVIVERSFEDPVDVQRLQAQGRAVDWCLQQLRVQYLVGYVARDLRHVVCLFRAPDAESVRQTQRQGGLPYDRVWSARPLLPPTNPNRAELRRRASIIAQHEASRPLCSDDLCEAVESCDRMSPRLGAVLVESYLSIEGRHLVHRFEAGSLNRVRVLSEGAGLPVTRSWQADVP